MDNLQKYISQIKLYIFGVLIISNAFIIGLLWYGTQKTDLENTLVIAVTGIVGLISPLILVVIIARHVSQPIRLLWQAILHVSPQHDGTPPPNIEKLKIGREMVTSLTMLVYQMAGTTLTKNQALITNENRSKIITDSLPLPIIVIGKDQNILFVNEAASKYLGNPSTDLIGKNIYSTMDLSFSSEHTLDVWLNDARANKLTASESWDRVRIKMPDNKGFLQFDMAAYYNKNNPSGVETILALFDHTKRYAEDDQALSFISLAVHELRTPLTLLRGYIEVFEEELSGKLDEELNDFLNKMQAAAQQLTAFVNNILNVARVESDQLILQLHEEKWGEIVKGVVNDFNLRAGVQGKAIECAITADLPTVAADRVSTYEVLGNLLDNAIKYSAKSQKIIIKAYPTKDGLVETTVQDFGTGIPENVLPNLFEKFYRNFKTKASVGGNGLGLYLCKSIISAHGGNIWVKSKEGEGTTVGFTLKPYRMLAAELKTSDNKDIVRGAHGWIKNHSLYRR